MPRYNFTFFRKELQNFSTRNKVPAGVFALLYLYAAEDFFVSVYSPKRYGIRPKKLEPSLVNPNNLMHTLESCAIQENPLKQPTNVCLMTLTFASDHPHLDHIQYGFANEALKLYCRHALNNEPVPDYNPLQKNQIKFQEASRTVTISLPIKTTTQLFIPSAEHHFLPLFRSALNTGSLVPDFEPIKKFRTKTRMA